MGTQRRKEEDTGKPRSRNIERKEKDEGKIWESSSQKQAAGTFHQGGILRTKLPETPQSSEVVSKVFVSKCCTERVSGRWFGDFLVFLLKSMKSRQSQPKKLFFHPKGSEPTKFLGNVAYLIAFSFVGPKLRTFE